LVQFSSLVVFCTPHSHLDSIPLFLFPVARCGCIKDRSIILAIISISLSPFNNRGAAQRNTGTAQFSIGAQLAGAAGAAWLAWRRDKLVSLAIENQTP
jgi:hypothetical protein